MWLTNSVASGIHSTSVSNNGKRTQPKQPALKPQAALRTQTAPMQVRFYSQNNNSKHALGLNQTQADQIAKTLAPHFEDIYGPQVRGIIGQRILNAEKNEFQDNFYYGVIQKKNGKFVVSAGMKEALQPIAKFLEQQSKLPPEALNKINDESETGGLTIVLQKEPSQETLNDTVLTAEFESIQNETTRNKPAGEQLNVKQIKAQEKVKREAERQKLNVERAKAGKPALPPPSDEEESDPLEDFKQYVMQESFKLAGEGQKTAQFVAWPIFQRLMTGTAEKDGKDSKFGKFSEDLETLGLYQLKTPGLAQDDALQEEFQPISNRLAAFRLAQKHYVDSLEVDEVWKPLLGGIAIGGGGETALEMAHMENNPAAGWMRSGLLVGVDVFDNLLAQIPNVKQQVAKNNWTLDAKGITGDDSFANYAKNRMFSKDRAFKGPAGGTVSDAIRSAVLGAGSGSIFAIPAGRALSNEQETAWTRALMGGLGALGTSLSLPLKLQADKTRTKATLEAMKKEKWIDQDAPIDALALQDAMAGTGNAASLKAFSLVPLLSGGLLALEKAGVPRKWTQKLYMSISPGAENLLSLILMVNRQYFTAKGDMKAVENRILESAISGSDNAEKAKASKKEDAEFIARKFNSGWGSGVGWFATHPGVFYTALATILTPMYLYSFKDKLSGKETGKPAQHAGRPEDAKTGNKPAPSATKPELSAQPPASQPAAPVSAPTQPQVIAQPKPLAPGYALAPWNQSSPAVYPTPSRPFAPMAFPKPSVFNVPGSTNPAFPMNASQPILPAFPPRVAIQAY